MKFKISKENSDIVILGAGVAGLTMAIALSKKGFKRIKVFERKNEATSMGGGMVLWANSFKILEELGLAHYIVKIGGRIGEMERRTKSNDLLGAVSVTLIDDIIGGKSIAIYRSDLQDILLNKAAELSIRIYYGHESSKLTHADTSTTVEFSNGLRHKADLVLGAEGRMNSITRKYVNGNNKPIFQNMVNWIGKVESTEPIFEELNVSDYWGVGERFGIVPITAYKAYWAAGKKLPLNAPEKDFDDKGYLKKVFSNWPNLVQKVIELSSSDKIKYIEVFDHNPISKWYMKNVCLIGDAAHAALPTSGQGACQAIEDAWHFAEILTTNEDLDEVFTRFQNLRGEKTKGITIAARQLGESLFEMDLKKCQERNNRAKNTNYKEASINIANFWAKNL